MSLANKPLTGEAESTLDAKGRFLLPGLLRKQLPEDNPEGYVIARGQGTGKFLNLYTARAWEEMLERNMGEFNELNSDASDFMRLFMRGATPVEFDSAGRLLVPPSLKTYAGLKKDLTLMGSRNKIEIWDSETLEDWTSAQGPARMAELQKLMAPDVKRSN